MKNHAWPVAITAFCILFFLGMVGFVVFTTFHREDLVSADYYSQELRYQQRIDSDRRARALGVTNFISYDAQAAIIRLLIPGAHSTTGAITLYRPSSAGLDQHIPLALDSEGNQVIPTGVLQPGRWLVRAEWTTDGQLYFAEQEVVTP